MMLVFEIRAKITEIYQKYDFFVKTALKFLLMFLAFSKASKAVGYNTTLSGTGLILVLAAFCSVLPPSLMVLVAVVYVFLQILTASVLISVTVMMVFLVLYMFFLRFAPKEGLAVIATPVLMSLGFPYLIPLFLGMFGSILSVVPAACGVVAFYMLKAVRNNIITIDEIKALKDQALQIYMDILDDLIKRPQMYVIMAVFAVVIIVIVLVRSLQMDFSFEITLGFGTGVMILGYIIGSLKYDMDLSVTAVLFGSVLAMGIVAVCLFFYRVLNYTAVERVQFEDERYYYYVTAVPKITTGTPKKAIRKVLSERKEEEDAEESEEEAIEAMESMLAGKKSPYQKPLTPGLAKRLRRDVAPKPEDYEGEDDDDDEVVIKGPKGEQSDAGLAFLKSGFDKLKAFLPKKDKKTKVRRLTDEEEDDESEVPNFFAEPSEEPDEEPEASERDEDYE
ncbi:MAG: hypothetical protein J5872_02110 [Lachnospiraceae bacterium]|nr:hypothetical protein [Lachnospiraceae bacterium]